MKSSFPLRTLLPQLGACLLLAGACDVRACDGRLHIEVADDSVYALDYAAVVAAQPGLQDCASADLVLTQRDQEIPLRISGDRGGRFAAGSRIQWLGRALHGPQSWYDPYSLVNVYQLSARPGAHARVHAPAAAAATAAAARRTLHLEQENLLLRLNNQEMRPGDEPDVWQWAKLTPIDPQPFTLTFDLDDADLRASGADTVSLTLNLRGVSNVTAVPKQTKPVDHVVEVTLNGKSMPQVSWDGRNELRKTLELPRAQLREKDNMLVLRVPKRMLPWDNANFIVDAVMFNWLEVNYALRTDATAAIAGFSATADGAVDIGGEAALGLFGSDGSYQELASTSAPRRVMVARGVEYFSDAKARVPQVRAVRAADLRNAKPGFDYLIVAHPRLLDAIQPLAALHREQGMQVAVYDVDDVYDQFSGGIVHPAAIRDLVAWGREHWQTKPRYLLLVGDASTDIHHDVRNGKLSGSSYLLSVHPGAANVAQGEGFTGMVSYAYPEAQHALANRNLIPTWQYPSAEGQSASDNEFVHDSKDFHPALAVGRLPVVEPDEVKAIVAKTIDYVRNPSPGMWRRGVTLISTSELAAFKQASDQLAAELDRQGYATKSIYTDATDRDAEHYQRARATLREDLDGGDLIVHFLGHGGSYIWRVGAMGDLFSLDDVSALKNAGRYPMVLAMTCFSAPFDNPSDDSIGERFLREPSKGAIAVFAASWKNWPNPAYSRSFIHELLTPGQRIGDAIMYAKAHIADRDFVEMYNLLGDPAVVLAQPPARLAFMRDEDRWNPHMIVRIPAPDFGGDVDIDWLDAQDKVLSSAHYQLRDTQFALALPDKATDLRVYATDSRDGFAAFGAASVLAPDAPKAAQKMPAATVDAMHSMPRPPHAWNPHDDVSQLGFEANDADAKARTAVTAH